MRIGVDLGGTKIEAIGLGGRGEVLARRRMATPRDDYDGTVAAIAGLVAGIEREAGARGSVGVGIPGAESLATGTIKNANSVWLIGRPFARDLADALGRPVRLANDANCFALSEASDGAAAGAKVVFGVILGTGVGGGVIVDGQVLVGVNAIAGEWGHNPLPWPADDERPGPPCYCGKRGCIETFVSGPGLARDHRAAGGDDLAPSEIAARAAAGDGVAEAALARYEDRLARALATVINVVDPEAIVLGGGVSNLERLYARVPARWGEYAFSDRVDTRLLRARHGDSSGVRGAAWLWPDEGSD
ncbi:MAG: ROK family protein [Alphaproteobacteria bacterium]